MLVSMKGDYGVRALVELALRYGEGPIQSSMIAARQAIPEPYLDQLLTSLRRAGLIRSVRGPQGGHALVKPPHEIRLSDALLALEGSLAPINCLDDPAGCTRPVGCSLREVWEQVHRATLKILDGITIADLADKERAGANAARYAI
jgi:Rrf2 family protein